MGLDYHHRRLGGSLHYRLIRRTQEVRKYLKKYSSGNMLLDVGTADAQMPSMLKEDGLECFCTDISIDLLKANTDPGLSLIQADAVRIPFKENSFNIVIATAVLEHLQDPMPAIREFARVLDNGGIVVATSPNPIFEKIASTIGHIHGEHQCTLNIKELRLLFSNAGFEILECKGFMFSPLFNMPFDETIEEILNRRSLSLLMTNQVIVCRI